MNSNLERIYQDTVERFRQHLRGREPMPDLTGVPEELHSDLDKTFALLESITGVSDSLVPPIEKIAARLGITVPPTLTPVDSAEIAGSNDVGFARSALDLLAELEVLNGKATASYLDPDEDIGSFSLELVAEYRQLGALIGVCLVDCPETALTTETTLRAAGQVLARRTAYTAVALVGRGDDHPTVVVPPEDCQDALDPAFGHMQPSTSSLTLPFLTAIKGHLSYVEPRWEDVPSNLALAASFDIEKVSRAAATDAVQTVSSANTTIKEKREALRSLGARESRVLASIPSQIIGRIVGPADLPREIDRLAGIGTS